jgi:hypothetical protein
MRDTRPVRFCDGRPERGARPLDPDERVALGIAARRAAQKAAFAVAAPLVVVPAGAVVAAVVGADAEGPGATVGVLALFAVLGGLPVAVGFAARAVRAARALRRDVRRGEALVFGEGREETVVLPESVHVVRRGGRVVAPVRRVALGDAAAPPPAPATYALSAAEAPRGLGAYAWVKRALSPEERAEIERHARRFARISPGLLFFSVVGAAATAAALGEGPAPGVEALPAVGLAAVVLLEWWRVLRDRRAATRLRADADEGWAYRGVAEGATAWEVLPASGAFWTRAGAPAEWRLHHGA